MVHDLSCAAPTGIPAPSDCMVLDRRRSPGESVGNCCTRTNGVKFSEARGAGMARGANGGQLRQTTRRARKSWSESR